MGFIYKILFVRIRKGYIGQAIDVERRIQEHISKINTQQCPALYKAMLEEGVDSFEVMILCECPNDQLNEREKFYIKEHNTMYPNGYNLATGGTNIRAFHNGVFLKFSEYFDQLDKYKDAVITDRKHNNYDLPPKVYELDFNGQQGFRFEDEINKKQHNFLHSKLTMDEKYDLVMECYEKIMGNEEYERVNKYKRNPKDNLVIPKDIVVRGANGFAINTTTGLRMTFDHNDNTREQNLANAIKCLERYNNDEANIKLTNAEKGRDNLEYPKGIRKYNDGFTVNVNGYGQKKFVDSKQTREENLHDALIYLGMIYEGIIPQGPAVKFDPSIRRIMPNGVQFTSNATTKQVEGYLIKKIGDLPQRKFNARDKTRDENLDAAIAYYNEHFGQDEE
jgi:group I intron endonuclease